MSATGTVENIHEQTAERWSQEIAAAEKELEKFHKRADLVNKRFLDDRDLTESDRRWFNIFYANTCILESALYAQLPKPTVTRKYLDYNDEVGRVAAMILQRAITDDLDDPQDTTDSTLRHCVQDRLVPGLAVAWIRLETDTEPISIAPVPGMDESYEAEEAEIAVETDQAPTERIVAQRICVDYVFWGDFIWSPCRVWNERRWVGRKVYMTREELIERFGVTVGSQVPLDFNVNNTTLKQGYRATTPREDVLQKAVVYEIWDRTSRQVIWYSKGMQTLLDVREDFLGLRNFEPCPQPMLANVSTSNTVPRPDHYMIQDQYAELDTVNNRISKLVSACKVVGTYDKAAAGVSRMLSEGFDNQLIPVDNWGMFAEKGGVEGSISWLPLEQIVTALTQLNQAREAIKGQIYELTGIADIVRGASKASETLGAQQIKAQFASVRIKKLQDEVARFASDIMRIKAEIMLKHFEPSFILEKSNIMNTPDAELAPQALEMLKATNGFEWRVEINADTLAQADYAAEKADRNEFMNMFAKFMNSYPQMVQAAPASIPLMLNLLKWTVAGFRNARDIEGLLDRELDRFIQESKMPKPEKPDPEMLKLQQEAKIAQEQHQMEMQAKQFELQAKQQEALLDAQQKRMEAYFEQQQQQQELVAQQRENEQRLMFEQMLGMLKLELAEKQGELKMELAREQAKSKDNSGKRPVN